MKVKWYILLMVTVLLCGCNDSTSRFTETASSSMNETDTLKDTVSTMGEETSTSPTVRYEFVTRCIFDGSVKYEIPTTVEENGMICEVLNRVSNWKSGQWMGTLPYVFETCNSDVYYSQTGALWDAAKNEVARLSDEDNEIIKEIIFKANDRRYDQPGGVPTKEIRQEISTLMEEKCKYGWSMSKVENYTSYYGIYGDCVVVFCNHLHTASDVTHVAMIVGNYVFQYGQNFEIYVYRSGELVALKHAYQEGWLTDEQLSDIWLYHTKTNGRGYLE